MAQKNFRSVIHSFNDPPFIKYFHECFTAADWTAYPFATQNKKDFQNLLSVYLDAAFAANLNPLDFAQEGIRVELEDDQPVYKGVVFNEMKGR